MVSDPLWSQDPSGLHLHTMLAFPEGRARLPVYYPGSVSTGTPPSELSEQGARVMTPFREPRNWTTFVFPFFFHFNIRSHVCMLRYWVYMFACM